MSITCSAGCSIQATDTLYTGPHTLLYKGGINFAAVEHLGVCVFGGSLFKIEII